jgi:hypothetical protein
MSNAAAMTAKNADSVCGKPRIDGNADEAQQRYAVNPPTVAAAARSCRLKSAKADGHQWSV